MADAFGTPIVAPFSQHIGKTIVNRARLPLTIDGQQHILQLDRLAAVAVSQIGPVRGSAAALQDDIKNGIDLLVFGS